MKDQASELRKIVDNIEVKENNNARIIAVSSGKGGVGKSNFTLNLGVALSKRGKNITIIDADLGLANIDILLGLVPKYSLTHVIKNQKKLSEIMIKGPNDINIVSGGSGVIDIVDLKEEELKILIESFEEFTSISDYILIDTGAGLSQSVLSFIEAANELIIIVTSDPTSITDAYALIKNLNPENTDIKVVVNRIESSKEGKEVFDKLNIATDKFLNKNINLLGYLYEDQNVKKAVKKQEPYTIAFPNSLASKGIELIAEKLETKNEVKEESKSLVSFIRKLFKSSKRAYEE